MNTTFSWFLLFVAALLLCCCNARNFKYATHLNLDMYRHYKNGITEAALGTLFPLYPWQIFSCDMPIGYTRFSNFENDHQAREDTFEWTASRTDAYSDSYFESVPHDLIAMWSSCYQNFLTRYCTFAVYHTENIEKGRYKIRQCKHMYFPKSPPNMMNLAYLVREAKPYINLHMREHIQTNRYANTFEQHGVYPPGFEYLVDWNFLGYDYSPVNSYEKMDTSVRTVSDVLHGIGTYPHADFYILYGSWHTKMFHIVHEIIWTFVVNNRGVFTHELVNAFQDADHIQLHYLVNICTKLYQSATAGTQKHDIVYPDMCPNPCRKSRICANKPNTMAGECIPTGVDKNDFRCACLAGYKWSSVSMSCEEALDCNNYCDISHTRSCFFVPVIAKPLHAVDSDGIVGTEGHLKCECYPDFQGEKCQWARNACVTGGDMRESGNHLCRTDMGGNCTPNIGTSYFKCSCPSNFRNLKSVAEDNCLASNTICDTIICANNGACHNSPDGASFECECTPGFEGKLCDKPIAYHWTHWSDWTNCDSNCGRGWQIRLRVCWDKDTGRPDKAPERCSGNSEVIRACNKHCLEFQAGHYIAIDLSFELLFRMLLAIACSFLVIKILFDLLFAESDYVFAHYLRPVVVDLVRNAVGTQRL